MANFGHATQEPRYRHGVQYHAVAHCATQPFPLPEDTFLTTAKAATGIAGLDDILGGGLTRSHIFLLEGQPGAGKTTVALQFLLEGVAQNETCLYITLSETARELREGALSHGWELDERVTVFELTPPELVLDLQQQQSLLYSSDLELGEATRQIFDEVERVKPSRVVLDSLSEVRLLAQGSLRYRRQILAIKHYFARFHATVLLLDDMTSEPLDKTLHSIAHGVIRLEETAPDYGAERRRLRIMKYRGQKYRGGYHDFTIQPDGIHVYPRLVAAEFRARYERSQLTSGIAELDALLGGGVENGSSTLIIGPAGTGKSLLSMVFAAAAVERGEKVALFIFDEELSLLFERMKNLGIDLEAYQHRGQMIIQQVDAAEQSPGEFAHMVRTSINLHSIKTVVIDSINGYHAAMMGESTPVLHIHELLLYLNRLGASTFMTVAQQGLVGDMKAPVDITYLADTVILLRYFEALGNVRRAVSVIKKRFGSHENTIREYKVSSQGMTVGEPLSAFQGVLRGVPTYIGEARPLLEADDQ